MEFQATWAETLYITQNLIRNALLCMVHRTGKNSGNEIAAGYLNIRIIADEHSRSALARTSVTDSEGTG